MSDLLRPTAGIWNLVIRDAPQIAFGDWIIQPIEEHLQRLLRDYVNLPVFPPGKFNLPAYVAIGASSTKTGPELAKALRQRLLTTLRLYRDGSVTVGEFWWTNLSATVWSPWDFLHITNLPHPQIFAVESKDVLGLEAVDQIVARGDLSHLWLATALTRFHDSYTRAEERDAYTDLVIALEALCGDGGENLAYKVTVRCAHLVTAAEPVLAVSPGSRQDIFKRVKVAYDVRSKYVHGGRPKKVVPITDVRALVRCALLRTIQLVEQGAPQKHKTLAEYIDLELLLK